MKTFLTFLLTCGFVCAADATGVTAEVIPTHVRPGDLFELRVVMERPEYGRFTLDIPAPKHLHRVAIDRVPVKLEDGLYRQTETWWLQAGASGSFPIENAQVQIHSETEDTEFPLPPLRVEVLPYPEEDPTSEPVAFPPDDPTSTEPTSFWWWLVPIFGLIAGVWLGKRRHAVAYQQAENDDPLVESILAQLDAGTVDVVRLQQLAEQDLSPELREQINSFIYAGNISAAQLAASLRKEGTP